MRIAFRVDAGLALGSGHLMRCLALAQALREQAAQVDFICADHLGFDPGLITAAGFALHRLPLLDEAEDAKSSAAYCLKSKPDWLVVDHYGLGQEWERVVRTGVPRLMAVEDVAGRAHEVDLLLDQNLRDDAEVRYRPLLPAACITLLGPRYALLRSQFADVRRQCQVRHEIPPRILLFMGGGDERNTALGMLEMLARCRSPFMLDAVVGGAHPAKAAIEKFCVLQGWSFHCQVEAMADLMAKADLAIGAGGVTAWERCALGLPSLLVILADNQEENVAMLERMGAAISLGWWEELTQEGVCRVLDELDGERLAAMSRAGFAITDGLGAGRVAEAMLAA